MSEPTPLPFEIIQQRISHRAASIQAARNRRGIRTGPTQAAILAEKQILSELQRSHEHNKGTATRQRKLHLWASECHRINKAKRDAVISAFAASSGLALFA